MSRPRAVLAGDRIMLSRRCAGRHHYMRPSEKINLINLFCLAMAAERTGVIIHAFVFLSNHYHIIITDPHARMPEFMHWLNEYTAKCINAELGRWENFWAPGSYSAVSLVAEEDFINKLLYLFANPVSAGLVPTLSEWPGAFSTPADMAGTEREIARPKGFFRDNGPVPETVRLKLEPPPGLEIDIQQLERLVAEREQEIRAETKREGRKFLGRRNVLAQSPTSKPRGRSEERRGLNPRLAAIDKWRRIEALQRLKEFVAAYREAWLRFRAGQRDVLFPLGTYAMRIRFGALCHGP